MEAEDEQIRDELSGSYLEIAKGGRSLMFENIDSFFAMSRENTSVKEVELYPFDSNAGNYEFWDKVGQMVGNLMELEIIIIHFDSDRYGNWERSPDWEILTRILRYLRRTVVLCSSTEEYDTESEAIQGLARAIHGHLMISGFSSQQDFTFENLGPWCSALATLPSLEHVIFGLQEPRYPRLDERQRDLLNLEPLKELLRTPALRKVAFNDFSFTYGLCHAVADVLEGGSSVTDISFESICSFPDGGTAIIANALKRNASVTSFKFLGDFFDDISCNSLAAVLLCNSTLQNLTVHSEGRGGGRWLSPILLSLGMNMTLKSLTVSIFDKFGDELCAAIRSGLAKNSTLEELSLRYIVPSDDDGTVSARNILSFLRTNSTLKSLAVHFVETHEESHISAFRMEALKMVEENAFLESITVTTGDQTIKLEELLTLVSALQLNTTLKTLGYQTSSRNLYLSDDEVNQLVSILMKNYGLECLVPKISCADDRIVNAILRLNRAGRRYLIKDGSSVPKGVEVLSAVNDDINCVFLHLLENPGLCNRRAVETTMRKWRPGDNLDESSST
jgi:hypothetical protein